MSVFLIRFDPTGRNGEAGSEELTIKITHLHEPFDYDSLIEGLKYIASAHSGVRIVYADVYEQVNG